MTSNSSSFWGAVALACLAPVSLLAQSAPLTKSLPLPGEVFAVDGRTAFLILPPQRSKGVPTPWVWYAPTLRGLPAKAEKWMFEKFLAAGVGIAGVDVGESYGSPLGRRIYSSLYRELTEERGMARRASLLARSRGGLMLYNWAVEHPDAVACIAGIYPVCNLSSYPGLQKASGAYDMTPDQLEKVLGRHNPIARLAPLAQAGVPILHLHGDQDTVVPLEANSGALAKRYRELKGPVELRVIPGQGHNMWRGWFESERLVDFAIHHALGGGTTRTILATGELESTPPRDAVRLVHADGFSLVPEDPKVKSGWVFEDGVLTASPKWDSLVTADPYSDFRMHLEFNVNQVPGVGAEKNGNSGVYIQQRYEVQILNSFGVAAEDYKASYCGSIYRLKKPDQLVNKPAGEWQSFDIVFRAARWEGDKKIENARITVFQNGVRVHDDFALPRKTGAGKKEGPDPLPIKLQGHRNKVRFRNVWVQRLELEAKRPAPAPAPEPDASKGGKKKGKKHKKNKKGYRYEVPFDQIPPAPPLTPEQALKSFRLHEDFEISVAASDPMIQSPVAIRFDGDGRMWVVEMRAYMLNAKGEGETQPLGRISILTDADQDGVFESSKVFLDGLVLPRSIAFYKNGILYGGHEKLYFVENIDDRPGPLQVIDPQYAKNENVEHRTNGLLRGLDNWIYNVKSDARYREIDGKWVKDKTAFRGQWGVSQDNYGRLHYNQNWFGMKADHLMPNVLMRNPNFVRKLGATVMLSYRDKVFPARQTPGVNRGGEGAIDADGYLTAVTAACGPLRYRGGQFPKPFDETAFFCEPSAHFVRMLTVTEEDGLATATPTLTNREFLASTDERFRPVNLETGPDGSLFVVDLYHGVLQHKTYLTPYLREHVKHRNLESQPQLGRVYRVRHRGAKPGVAPKLRSTSVAGLVAHLSHPNGWWRDTAQQRLVDAQDLSVVPALRRLAGDLSKPLGQIHALWTLEGLGAVDAAALAGALRAEQPRVLEMAIRLAESLEDEADFVGLWPRLTALAASPHVVVRRQLAASLGQFPGAQALVLLKQVLVENLGRPLFREVAIQGLGGREKEFLELLGEGFTDAKFRGYLEHCLELKTTAAAFPVPRNKAHLASFRRGEQMFIRTCMACHGADGKGLAMLGPPLIGSDWVRGNPRRLAAILLQGMMGPIDVGGKEYVPATPMPGLKSVAEVDDLQLADVATFVRFAWGNRKGGVQPALFAAVRKKLADRETAFSAEELKGRFPGR